MRRRPLNTPENLIYNYVYRKINECLDVRGSSLAVIIDYAIEEGSVSEQIKSRYADHVQPEVFDLVDFAIEQYYKVKNSKD